jgi:hypothetical protein
MRRLHKARKFARWDKGDVGRTATPGHEAVLLTWPRMLARFSRKLVYAVSIIGEAVPIVPSL